jgi:hypothetical protein
MRVVSRMLEVDPLLEGMEEWLIAVAVGAITFGFMALVAFPLPSSALMRDIANVGIVLVLAYVVEAAWLTQRMITSEDDKGDLGMLLGIGIAGLIGVVVAILLSAHRAAGHGNLLDAFGLGWAVASLAAVGGLVAIQPWLAYAWEVRRKSGS